MLSRVRIPYSSGPAVNRKRKRTVRSKAFHPLGRLSLCLACHGCLYAVWVIRRRLPDALQSRTTGLTTRARSSRQRVPLDRSMANLRIDFPRSRSIFSSAPMKFYRISPSKRTHFGRTAYVWHDLTRKKICQTQLQRRTLFSASVVTWTRATRRTHRST